VSFRVSPVLAVLLAAAIGDAITPNAGFATLRCTNGLVVDLEAFQARSKLPSNPYDVVSDGRDGWYVNDGAANNVLHVDQAGKVVVIARFPSLAASGEQLPVDLLPGPAGASSRQRTTRETTRTDRRHKTPPERRRHRYATCCRTSIRCVLRGGDPGLRGEVGHRPCQAAIKRRPG
jgi:hypothetical protein